MAFMITTKEEMVAANIDQFDFVYISGDAYVDHPSFGAAIICRTLEAHGYLVGIIAQPDWHKKEEFMLFGEPKLGFLVSSGNIDSMVNHYSVNKKRRSKDSYTDNGEMGKRPDRAVIVYSQMLRRLYPKSAILIGGIEASLRRLAHYDYWDDKVRHSILIDSQADLLMFGMSENCIVEVADALASGISIKDVIWIRGTCIKKRDISYLNKNDFIYLPSFKAVSEDKIKYCEAYQIQHENTDAIIGKTLVEEYEDGVYVVQNLPCLPLSQDEMDFTYALPYERNFHPKYTYIPAIEEVKFSIVSNRGCFGSCSFCALTQHQGRTISSRSADNIVEEAIKITQDKDFKGYIHDVGGPTANFQQPSCKKQSEFGTCPKKECLHPKPCNNLEVSHTKYLEVLRRLRKVDKVKKVFIRSGIRYDYLMYDKDKTFFEELVQYHISGQLKVAPEHINAKVLDKMGKPNRELYEKFVEEYERINQKFDKNQFLVPYLMSSHPGCDLNAAIDLACYLKSIHHTPKQVQDFYPTPMTRSTCMYYTGIDPLDMKPVYVPKTPREKAMQRALIQFTYPQNYDLVYEALKEAGRLDLVGSKAHCLIRANATHPGLKDDYGSNYGSNYVYHGHSNVQNQRNKPRSTEGFSRSNSNRVRNSSVSGQRNSNNASNNYQGSNDSYGRKTTANKKQGYQGRSNMNENKNNDMNKQPQKSNSEKAKAAGFIKPIGSGNGKKFNGDAIKNSSANKSMGSYNNSFAKSTSGMKSIKSGRGK